MNSITRELNIVANFDKIQRSKTRVSSIKPYILVTQNPQTARSHFQKKTTVKQVAKYTSKLYSKCGNDIMW